MSAVIEQQEREREREHAGVVSVPVCALDEIPVGMGRAFEVDGRSIAIFRTRGGRVFAVDNACPHRGAPLADGLLAGDRVVCPYHAFRFELATGACDHAATCPIRTFDVQLDRAGQVVLKLPAT